MITIHSMGGWGVEMSEKEEGRWTENRGSESEEGVGGRRMWWEREGHELFILVGENNDGILWLVSLRLQENCWPSQGDSHEDISYTHPETN